MGEIHVHEFTSLDGVIDARCGRSSTASIRMGEAIGAVTARAAGSCSGG